MNALSLASPRPPTCPNEVSVDAFVSGAVDDEGRRRMLAHLGGCQACCHLVGALMTSGTGAPVPSRPTPSAGGGPLLAHYRVGEPVGFGGMGMVYAAYDPRLDRKVALKVLWSDGSADGLHHEARAMAKLAHPNVVPVFDVGVDRGRVYVAMELVDGGTVRTWLTSAARPWTEVLARFRQAGNGIAAAHEAGLVHRDIKPENLLLRRDGTVLVSDFGLARTAPADLVSRTRTVQDTTTTTSAGTPAYMAPEQLHGDTVDARADVYSFSVALWEALFGARPFVSGTADELLASIARGPNVPPPRHGVPHVPPHLAAVLARGMAFHRHDRFQSISELLAACEGPVAANVAAPYGPPGNSAPLAQSYAPQANGAPAHLASHAPQGNGYAPVGQSYTPHGNGATAPLAQSYAPQGNGHAPVGQSYAPQGNGAPLMTPQVAGPYPNNGPAMPQQAYPYGSDGAPHAAQSFTPNATPFPPPHASSLAPAMAPSVSPAVGLPASTPPSSTKWGVIAAIGTALVLLAVGGALVVHKLQEEPAATETPTEKPKRSAAATVEPTTPATASNTPGPTIAPGPAIAPTTPQSPATPTPPSPNVAPGPTAPKPAPSATLAKDAGAPPSLAAPARKVRGQNFAPYGFDADKASATLRAHEGDFSACGPEGPGCVSVTCDFNVAESGAVASSACKAWQSPGQCPATEACLNQKIRAIRFPAAPKAGACQVSFGR